MNAEEIRKLVSIGLSAEQLAAVADIIAARGESIQKVTRAERNRRYYERLKSSESVLNASETSENVLIKTPPSPPLPPPPLSPLHPPIPAPTCPPAPPQPPREAQASKPGKGSKRQGIEADIISANHEPLPLELLTPAFRDAWADWCQHRADLYRRSDRKPWTALAARKTLSECARNGAEIAVMAITAAVSNGWQGLFWDRLQIPAGKASPAGTAAGIEQKYGPVQPNKWAQPAIS